MTRLSDEAARAMGSSFGYDRLGSALHKANQRSINLILRRRLDQLTPYMTNRTRPMHINITIRAIANGFLVESGGDMYDPDNPGGTFFPDFVAMTDALPQMAYDARERAELSEARMRAESMEKRAAYSGEVVRPRPTPEEAFADQHKGVKGFTIGEGMTGYARWQDDGTEQDRAFSDEAKEAINRKLPEEQAAAGKTVEVPQGTTLDLGED